MLGIRLAAVRPQAIGALDQLTSAEASFGSLTYAHDTTSNVASNARPDRTAFGDGRPATVTRNALPEATYGYDAFQRRVLQTAGGTTRHFLHDPDGHLLAEATAAGVTATEYVWLSDTPLALVADVDTASPRLHWFHTDQLGTPQKLTDTAGNIVWDAVLEPFGELAQLVTGLVAQPLRLPGQYADPATGLHQNWWRDYDPGLGRYLQPAPVPVPHRPARHAAEAHRQRRQQGRNQCSDLLGAWRSRASRAASTAILTASQ